MQCTRTFAVACTHSVHTNSNRMPQAFPISIEFGMQSDIKIGAQQWQQIDNLTSKRNTVNNHVILGFAALQYLYDK